MDSSQSLLLTTLLVFKNTHQQELIKSLHVYRLEDGKENEVEREFVFSKKGSYVEMAADPVLELQRFRVSEVFQGQLIGLWLCILAFHSDRPPHSTCIPSILSILRNPKLMSIPALAIDLQRISLLGCRMENKEPSQSPSKEMCEGNRDNCHHSKRNVPVFDQDLNCLPYTVATSELPENQQIEESTPGTIEKKKKRAASEDVARIALEDLVKNFDLPIVEASRNLKVGLTVLKKKCREFGIPRWPHRKIKSLDSLIHDLQEEAERQQQENKAAAMAVAKRQKMLESEKEIIERKPFMEIQKETKRFRQDVFKRRHRARALKNEGLKMGDACSSIPSSQTWSILLSINYILQAYTVVLSV